MNTGTDTHDKTVLVTGATGNHGGAAARHLLANGWRAGLMDFHTWLDRSGKALLLTQLHRQPA